MFDEGITKTSLCMVFFISFTSFFEFVLVYKLYQIRYLLNYG